MAEGGLDLPFYLITGEQRDVAVVELHLAQILWHDLAHEVASLFINLFLIDENLADVLAKVVADGPYDDVAVLENEHRCRVFVGGGLDGRPQFEQVVQIPLQFLGGLADPGCAYDESHTRGNIQGAQGLAEIASLVAFHPPGYAAGARIVGHQHQIATGEAGKSRQGRAFCAALFLLHLDDNFLALAQGILDAYAATGAIAVALFVGEIGPIHFLEGQESVTFGAVVDEGGFEAGLDAGNFSFVDTGLFLRLSGNLDVEIVQILAVHHCHPKLLGLGRIYQHSLHANSPFWGASLHAGNGLRPLRDRSPGAQLMCNRAGAGSFETGR